MDIDNNRCRLDDILAKALRYEPLTQEDMIFVLQLRRGDYIEKLFKTARELRTIHFQDKIFLYGFIYISTYCRNECRFCFYRKSNSESLRYRKSESQIKEAALTLARSGVHLIDLTMGEDPEFFNNDGQGFKPLIQLVKTIKKATGLSIMISPGVVPDNVFKALAKAGADWYACYQETYDESLFQVLRSEQSYQARLNAKISAHKHGLLIEDGILAGIMESAANIAHSIEEMRKLGANQVRVMNFVPQKGTPMGHYPRPDSFRELMIIALMRLVFPDRLIPATLDVEGLAGLERRLDAGANVVTSIVPPGQGLAGVAQSSLDIDEARRTAESVLPVLKKCGLRVAANKEYQKFLEVQKPYSHQGTPV